MSLEQFEIAMASAGYNEEQITEMKATIQECAQTLAQTLEEIIERIRDFMLSVWEGVKETMAELGKSLNNYFQQTKEAPTPKVSYVPYNPPNNNQWYNQYTRKMTTDIRIDLKPIIIHRN